ncbi:Stp1/IreP family PP2C-type Ser/Thr phosphatase [Vulgatibacter incomptus]|uniref:Serine/threonine phosphatase PrpC n=1 Tax=Vulgatibacter incomptus TaxID=1391653 RepID=A0A0K1PE80_9BACT|nr:Stp1/IreP family PP2C-type Ser/Thr phosphatase [Vulgatibacter incomptus]AKU91825.1 serine/threonine phosphatase PrpC [Vulgatibacter incomptus]
MRIEAAGSTHVGMKRSRNEDSFLVFEEERLFVVADGMGGHVSGEIASSLAVAEMEAFFRLSGRDRELTWPFKMEPDRNYEENRLATAIKQANARIVSQSRTDPRCKGMGTTVAALHLADGAAYIAWAGDSRVYRLRDGELLQLSEDHSLLNDLIKANKLSPEEVEHFPHKNVIVRALGIQDALPVDVIRDAPRPDDLYLLCSDGLSGLVSDGEIAAILGQVGDDRTAVDALIESANAAGGNDNITVVLVRCRAA